MLNYILSNGRVYHLILLYGIFLFSCNDDDRVSFDISPLPAFAEPVQITIDGYTGDAMEPFISADGTLLLFNNLNHPEINTNLHYARKVGDDIFEYLGEIEGVNTESLEGVPSMTRDNQLYFVSTRSYAETLSTIYIGNFIGDRVVEVNLVENISRNEAGWVNFDAEISRDGAFLYFVEGRFDSQGGPYESDILIAKNRNGTFDRNMKNNILININSVALEYAPCISSDFLELYFTRVEAPLTENSNPGIFVSIRNDTDTFFPVPVRIPRITGFVEGPALSPDNKTLYYHQRVEGKFLLYMVKKN